METPSKPIIFDADSIRAILDGRKTQTRRVVNLPKILRMPKKFYIDMFKLHDYNVAAWPARKSGWIFWQTALKATGQEKELSLTYNHGVPCPYGQVGDFLWVKENFWAEHDSDFINDRLEDCGIDLAGDDWAKVWYCATHPDPRENDGFSEHIPHYYGKYSSIFMPKWASRITLQITDIQVQRLQEITESDAYAEGIDRSPTMPHPLDWFRDRWDTLNSHRGLGWVVNPWVWVVKFYVVATKGE